MDQSTFHESKNRPSTRPDWPAKPQFPEEGRRGTCCYCYHRFSALADGRTAARGREVLPLPVDILLQKDVPSVQIEIAHRGVLLGITLLRIKQMSMYILHSWILFQDRTTWVASRRTSPRSRPSCTSRTSWGRPTTRRSTAICPPSRQATPSTTESEHFLFWHWDFTIVKKRNDTCVCLHDNFAYRVMMSYGCLNKDWL